MNVDCVHKTNAEFWNTKGSEVLGCTTLPIWGNYLPSEDKMNLLGELKGKSVLEIGCGNGYCADMGNGNKEFMLANRMLSTYINSLANAERQ